MNECFIVSVFYKYIVEKHKNARKDRTSPLPYMSCAKMYQGSGKAVWQIRNVASTAGDRFCAWTATARIWTREFEMVKGPMYPRLPWLQMAPNRTLFTIHRIHRQLSWKDLKRPFRGEKWRKVIPSGTAWVLLASSRQGALTSQEGITTIQMCKEPVLKHVKSPDGSFWVMSKESKRNWNRNRRNKRETQQDTVTMLCHLSISKVRCT